MLYVHPLIWAVIQLVDVWVGVVVGMLLLLLGELLPPPPAPHAASNSATHAIGIYFIKLPSPFLLAVMKAMTLGTFYFCC